MFSFAQDSESKKEGSNVVEQKIENLAESMENESTDYTNLIDDLIYYISHPLDLNHATKEELLDLGLLNEIQINHLLKHIVKNGNLITLYELQTIQGFDKATIDKILPYVTIEDTFKQAHISWSEVKKNGVNTLVTRYTRILEPMAGFASISDSLLQAKPNSRYLGTPNRYFARYRFTYGNNISAGFTIDQDAGEPFKAIDTIKPKAGFDYMSFHLYMLNLWKFRQIALGDYQVQLGQGVVFSRGLAFGKTADPLAIKRNAIGLKPYSSVNEALFLRGGAFVFGVKNAEVIVFGSHKKIDGNVVTAAVDTSEAGLNDAAFENVSVSSIQISGFHRTRSEIADRKSIDESIAGTNVSYKTQSFRIGATAVYSQFSAPIVETNKIYNQFDFTGTSNLNFGVDYNYVIRNFNFYGEVGRSLNGGMAAVNGVVVGLDPRFLVNVHSRVFQRNYQAMFANAMSENTTISNEQALYIGTQFKPNNYWLLSTYYDRFKFPWLKSNIKIPGSTGDDFFTQLNYTPNRKTNMYVRFRNRNKMYNATETIDEIDYVMGLNQRNYRFEATYPLSKSVSLKNRIEAIDYNPGEGKREKGTLFFTDINYKALSSPIQFTIRYALFDTDGFNSRMYAFEKEVLYAYSIPAYYYTGNRVYLMMRYTPLRNVDLWLRVASTIYDNQTSTGSSLTLIESNHKTELKVQLRVKF